MSGLAGLLAGRRDAGVYRWDGSLADLPDPVERAGWRLGTVDGRTRTGRAGLLRAVGETLTFPHWYGANFDALADCLRDLPGPTVLAWDGWEVLVREDHQAFHTALDVLGERAAEPDAPPFAALLLGPGPDLPALSRLD